MLEELANFIFTSKYSRYNEKLNRRETWSEAVKRLEKMHLEHFKFLSREDLEEIKESLKLVDDKYVMPSMRALQFGGPAILAHNARCFNCATRHVDSIRAFAEIFYLLLCGCGVGIGVGKKFTSRLPNLVSAEDKTGTVISYIVQDTIEGWADSLEALLNCYMKNTAYTGRKIVFDYSRIRKKGAILKTGGGKAPGFLGLKNCHQKIKALLDSIIEDKEQTRLKSVDIYDVLMHSADAVLSGGVRRSATSIVFDRDDVDMLNAKTNFKVQKKFKFHKDDDTNLYYGKVIVNSKKFEVELKQWEYDLLEKEGTISWTHIEPQRARSNNSVLLIRDEVTKEEFTDIINITRQWGEPGFVFADNPDQLFNPCFEISFIPVTDSGVCGVQFCNLTSINGGKIKTLEQWKMCVKAATIIGTLQAAYTNFPYLSNAAKELTEDEALLGVSMTGIMDSPELLLNPELQSQMAEYILEVNQEWAKKLGINPAARTTCVKPEGTGSLVFMAASGIHARHAHKYFRRVQCNKLDNVYRYFKKHNPHMCEESIWSANKTDDIIAFPLEVSEESMVSEDLSALKHLEYILSTQKNWVSKGTSVFNKKPLKHNVSCTVTCKDDEWDSAIHYIYKHRHDFAAVSLISHTGDKDYAQAPNEKISTLEDEAKFQGYLKDYLTIDYTKLKENQDETHLQQEIACSGGKCEIL